MILRLLIFILTAIFFAYAVSALANVDERMFVDVFGLKISMHAGFAIGLAIVGAGALMLTTSFAKDLLALPGRLKAGQERARLDRGMMALARGMEAVAIGDATDASHHARVAHRNLGDGSVTRLLTAQAAQLAGDDETAGKSFAAMLEAPETEFLGLRGLYGKALRDDDKDAARGYAERAYRLRPNATWAFQSVFDLALERGAWGDARAALVPAIKNRTIDAEIARRAEAALLAAAAYSAETAGDVAAALEESELALRSAPGLAPAAVLAARLHHAAGRTQRGTKILEQAFAARPHASLVSCLIDLLAGGAPDKSSEALRRLSARNPAAREAGIAQARAHILDGEFQNAIAALEPLLEASASARDCALMAEAIGGAHGESAAQPWLRRAASAVRDPTPGADGRFRFTREGWAQLVRAFMTDEQLGPEPIEGPPVGLAADEIRLLAAPKRPAPATDIVREEGTASPDPAAADPAAASRLPGAVDKQAADTPAVQPSRNSEKTTPDVVPGTKLPSSVKADAASGGGKTPPRPIEVVEAEVIPPSAPPSPQSDPPAAEPAKAASTVKPAGPASSD